MRRFEVALVFAIACIAIAQAKFGTGRYVNGRTCQRLPRPMSLSRFRSQVVDNGFTELMCSSNIDQDFADIIYRYNFAMREDVPTAGSYSQEFSGREFGDTSSGNCTVLGSIEYIPESSRLASFAPAANIFFDAGTRSIFFTSNATNHLFEVNCNETRGSDLRRQCCSGTYFIYFSSNTVPPHFFDWKAAARDLWRQMRISLSEFNFTLQYLPCPGAVP